MGRKEHRPSRVDLKIGVSILLAYGLTRVTLTQAQFTACTTRGNYTDDVYREIPIKNARTSVTISSPDFPKSYPRNIQCTWRIIAPFGHKVRLSFLEFHLEGSYIETGCHDYVSVRDGGLEFIDGKMIRRRCGSTKPPMVISSGTVLWLRFLTDKEVEDTGFVIKVLPVSASTSKRHIAIGVLLGLLLLILMTIILLCRKRFRKPDKNVPKVRKYQELPFPTETEAEQTDPPNDGPGLPEEDPWSNDPQNAVENQGSRVNFQLTPLRSSEASGYCSLSEEGDMFEFKDSCTFCKGSSKKAMEDESDQLEYTELLTVV
ncbi:uncharacterized protein LOC111322347 [Stylophora pistillata]|uniref:Cubilin n=1 Tax=Stylophora pistillata TaxID=50429 RepID=A0A2B4SQH1_STYPI|nr:uncharacterized protein LOC111322347 [Stylophora pistillata]PFX31349.1 Cubilin [Stylophora pistillata]